MDIVTLKAVSRKAAGSGEANRIRRSGYIPAIVYGHGIQPVSLQVSKPDFKRALNTKAGENVMLDLSVEGLALKESTCRIKSIQHNPVTDEIAHVDFTLVSLTEKITVMVPVNVVNGDEAVGVKEGGVLDLIHHEIEVECLPTQIPEKIEVDVKPLKMNDIVHIKDLSLPEGVTCTLDDEEALVTIHPPRKDEEPAVEEGAALEPEVIEKGKKPVEGEEGKETKDAKPAAGGAKPAAGGAKPAAGGDDKGKDKAKAKG